MSKENKTTSNEFVEEKMKELKYMKSGRGQFIVSSEAVSIFIEKTILQALEQGKREENERVGEVIQNISKSKGRPNWELELHTLEEVLTAIKQ